MEGYTVAFLSSSFNFQSNFQAGFSPGVPNFGGVSAFGGQAAFGNVSAFAPTQGINPQQLQQLFMSLMSAMQQLSAGYQSFGGMPMGQQGFNPYGQQGFNPYGQQGFNPYGQQSFGFPTFPQPQPFPGQNPFQFYPSPGTPVFGTQPGGLGTPGNPVSTGPGFNRNFDWQSLDPTTQAGRDARGQTSGLNDNGRAVLHLWGIQVTSAGKNNGGIYFNVLNNPDNFKPAEVELVRNLYNQEMAMFGGITGKLLDQQFFGLYQDMTGKDISGRYGNRPLEFAQGPINMENRLTGNNGLSSMDNTVIRMWGHDTLDNGAMDGSITEFTLSSQFALDKLDGSTGSLDRTNVEALLAADLADGVRDGNAMESAFIDSLDRIYFGGPGTSTQSVLQKAGINETGMQNIIAQWAQNPPPGIPPGVDITNIQNIGKCPVLGQSVAGIQPGLGGVGFY